MRSKKKNPKFRFAKYSKTNSTSESTAEEVLFEWSHHRISFTVSKVKLTKEASITDFGNERVKVRATQNQQKIWGGSRNIR